MGFSLHPILAQDCFVIGRLNICQVLLMNNIQHPWLILVPERENVREIFDLQAEDYTNVMQEVRSVTEIFFKLTRADKMNVASLGNQVPQLHVHIIARFTHDAAWPKPAWNAVPAIAYTVLEADLLVQKLRAALSL